MTVGRHPQPLHIALVTHHYSPESGAPQRRWGALVPRFVAQGHRVTVLCPPPHYPSGRAGDLPDDLRPGAVTTGEHGEQIVRVRFREHGLDLRSRTVDQVLVAADSVRAGLRHLHADRPDVLVATVPGIPSIGAGVALHHLLRSPLVVEMRDAWPDLIAPSGMLSAPHGRPHGHRRRAGWRGVLTARIHATLTRVQARAAAVVTTTDAFADVLRARGVHRVEVVRNGASLDEIPYLGTRRAGPADPLRVLYVGTVGRSQGLSGAVRAAAALRDAGCPVELRIAGTGVDEAPLRRLAAHLHAPVDVCGPVPRQEVFAHYAWADTLLVPLRDWVPLQWTVPSKLYEAMATGRHVTGVLAGEAAAILERTGAGDVVPPGDADALAGLWKQLATARAGLDVDGAGRAWAFRHSDDDRLAEQYLDLLAEVAR